MALVCVNGCRECTGCMDCQSTPVWQEKAFERMEDMNKECKKKLTELAGKLEEIYSELDDIWAEQAEAIRETDDDLQETAECIEMQKVASVIEDSYLRIEEATIYLKEIL